MTIQTQNNYSHTVFPGRKFTQPSKTVPNQSMTIKELIDRHARGLPISGNGAQPTYTGADGLGIDTRTLDLSELQELREKVQNDINEAKARYNNSIKKLKEAERDRRRQEAIDAMKEELSKEDKSNTPPNEKP